MRENHPIIAIDGMIFQASLVGGVSRVWRSLLEEWAKTDFAQHLLILSRANTAPIIPGIKYCVIPLSHNDYEGMALDRQMLQQVCDTEGVSLFISTYYSTPLSTPSVCLLHDMIPEILQADLSQLVWQEKHQAIRQALSYITVSQNTANDLIKFFPQIPVEKITIAHCGIDKIFKPATYNQIGQFRDKYQITKPYYLLVGDNRGYKRYLYFFKAFAQLDNHEEFDIVWIGNTLPISPEIQEFMSGSTLYSLHVDDDELVSAYSGAIALVYPSIYEGFGLPLLEAIACGCPTITCYNSSIPEVVGDAALFIEATQISSFVEALINVQAPNIRNALIGNGIEHSQHFSWEKMANTLKAKFLQAVEDFEQTGLSKKKIKKILFSAGVGTLRNNFINYSSPRFRQYAEHHDFEYREITEYPDITERSLHWIKIHYALKLMEELQEGDIIAWIDSDVAIVRGDIELTTHKSVAIAHDSSGVINTGVWAVQVNDFSKRFLQAIWDTDWEDHAWQDNYAALKVIDQLSDADLENHVELLPMSMNVTLVKGEYPSFDGLLTHPCEDPIRFRHFAGRQTWHLKYFAEPILFNSLPNQEFCRVCGAVSHAFARPIIMNKYEVQYYQCSNCGFIQTEDPYWLSEAYSSAISSTDTALVFRNIKLSHITNNLIFEYFDPQGIFLDYGGGYGLFVRLMRDLGYHFYWHDKYCTNLFAHGFEIDVIDPENSDRLELITCFEVFEHLVEPIKEIEQMLKLSKNILFGTQLLPENSPKPADWGYYALNEGQHISIFTRNSLEIIARKFGLNFYSNGSSLHLLTIKNFPDSLFDIPSLYTIYPPRFPSLILSDSSYLSSLDKQSATQEFFPSDDRISENSFIIFPDWTQPLEKLYAELRSVVQNIMMTENCDRFTLLIEVNDADSSLADEILSEVVMSLLMEPDLAFDSEPYISFISVSKLSHIKKKVLVNKIRARIELEHEDQKAIIATGITTIPTCRIDELYSLINSLQPRSMNKDLAPIPNNLSKEYRIGKYKILLPLEHMLDAYQAKWKRYDLALGYISQSIFRKYPNSSAIDIGANVGDTAALIRKYVNVPVLCVEGNPQFIEYLRHNALIINNVKIDECFIGEDGKNVSAENILSYRGTASISNSSNPMKNNISEKIPMKNLKTLITDNSNFASLKLLKIDTDGYDFLIINESIQTLSELLPIIYFEYDIRFQNDGAEKGLETVKKLFSIGYENFIIYDNFGNYLISISSQQIDRRVNQFLDIHTYLISNHMISESPAILYFDICAFPASDKDIFERIRNMEINQDKILTDS